MTDHIQLGVLCSYGAAVDFLDFFSEEDRRFYFGSIAAKVEFKL